MIITVYYDLKIIPTDSLVVPIFNNGEVYRTVVSIQLCSFKCIITNVYFLLLIL
jgi:hypothetical protein